MASHDESSMSRLKAALLDEDIEARAAPSCGECEEAADSPVRPVRVTVCAVLVSALLAAAVFVCVRVELLSNFSASAAAGGFSTSTIAGAHHLASTISRQEVASFQSPYKLAAAAAQASADGRKAARRQRRRQRNRRLLSDTDGPPREFYLTPYYADEYNECRNGGYNCDYYDYGINIEGTGSLGILANVLLDQINALSNLTPRLGARARADSAIVGGSVVGGTNTASRRNTTVVLQNQPSRDAGLYTTGAVGTDTRNITAFSAGTSTAVAKNIAAIGFPVNNYASSGESFVVTNTSGTRSGTTARDAGARSVAGGLAVAGNRAVATTTGTFGVGPVIGIFNAGNRAGASSQNGAFAQATGTSSFMYLQSASLGVVSPGNPRIMDNMQEKAKNETDKTDKNDYYDYSNNKDDLANAGSADGKPKGPGTGANMLRGSTPQPTNPSASFKSGEGDLSMSDKGGDYSNKVPFQDYYYYDQGEGGKPKDTNSAGGVSKAWLLHRDLVTQPSRRQFNDRAQVNTFGAANGYGWSRGVSQNDILATGTRNSAARLRAGAFGTGASSLTASVASVTDLTAIQCKKGRVDGLGKVGDSPSDCIQTDQVDWTKDVPAKTDDKSDNVKVTGRAGATAAVDAAGRDVDAPVDDYDGELLSPQQAALLNGNIFDGSRAVAGRGL